MTKVSRSYTLMLIRDDGSAFRLRMGARALRLLLALLLCIFPVGMGLCGWLSWTLWQDRMEYSAHRAGVEAALADAGAELTRLHNLKLFLEQHAPLTLTHLIDPQSLPTPPPGVEARVIAQLTELTQMEKLLRSEASQVAEQAAVRQNGATQNGNGRSNGQGAAPAATGNATGNGTGTAAVSSNVVVENSPDIPESPGDENALVRVENLLLSRSGASGLRVSFDIYNTEQQPQVSGSTTFELVQAGGVTPLTAQGDITFRIKRLKKIVGYPNLPRNALEAGAKLRITVVSESGTPLYKVDVPLP